MNRTSRITLKLQAILISFIMLITVLAPSQAMFALGMDQTANDDIVRSLSLSYKLKSSPSWTDLLAPYDISDSSKIEKLHARYSFEIMDNVDELTGEPNRTVRSGDFYLIDLPAKILISNPANGQILGNENRPIAAYSFTQKPDLTWQIRIEFTEYLDDLNEYEIHGMMEFDFTLDMSTVGEGSTTTIYIPIDSENGISIDVTKPVPPPTTPVSLTKTATSYSNLTRDLLWTVKMMPDIGIFSGCVFTDTIDIARLDLKSLKHGSITLVQGVDYTYDSTTGQITYTIPNGRDGINFQNIQVTTTAKRSLYGNLTATIVSNQANLSGGASYVDIDSNTALQTITPNWFGKSGTLYQGNRILWTLEANITTQSMFNAVITDYFQPDVQLDKTSVRLGATAVAIYDDAHIPATAAEIYGVYTSNSDGTAELKIYLPRTQANASTSKQTITLVTDVVPPPSPSPAAADPIYNNTATLTADYITDGSGAGTLPTINLSQVGVAVPHISVVKGHLTSTADDKRNGTIVWTITAASNLSEYGKSILVDTLPADQDYLPDEIFWGSQPITPSTDPSAVISTDGRKLTITFNSNNALATQQSLTVKTKIKQEIYGLNVNRDFTNQVRGALLSAETETELDASSDTESYRIQNSVITKSSAAYTGNTTKEGQNPRISFSIVINNNLMPLQDVVVTDDLSKIITEFKKSSETAFSTVAGVKWTYVPGTLKIVKNTGTRDSLDLAAIASTSTYAADLLTIAFGSGVAVNDKYTITFTAELAVSQNELFKENGTFRCRGNIADIVAGGLKTGKISTPATGNSAEVKNEVLAKSGAHMITEQQALWTIRLNQHKVTLDSSRVVDILPLGLTLDPTSIRLYKNVIGTDGNFVTGAAIATQGTSVAFTYTYLPAAGAGMSGRYTLTVDLPDNSTDYILQFATDIDQSLLGKQISNSAYYVGEAAAPENTNTSTMTLSSSSGGGSITKSSITVSKRSNDSGTLVSGAIFELNWLRNGDAGDPVFVRALPAEAGSVIFRGLTRGEIYTITETSAPGGYLLDHPEPVAFTAPSTGTGDAPPLTFYNTPIKTGSWSPAAIKKLDGKSIVHPFGFEISDGQTALMSGSAQSALPNGDFTVTYSLNEGIASQDILDFSDDYTFADSDPAGTVHPVATWTFYMSESTPALPGYGYDTTVYTLLVKVFNIKGQAALRVTVEDPEGNQLTDDSGRFLPGSAPVFQNTYRADGSIQLSAVKTVVGHPLAEGQFIFEMYKGSTLIGTAANQAAIPAGEAASQSAIPAGEAVFSGSINFEPIPFTQNDVGLQTYTIIEKNTGLPGYTYDPAVFTIVINVVDNDDGSLDSSLQSITKTTGQVTTAEDEIAFSNIYTASDLTVDLTAQKTLQGRVLESGQFDFRFEQVDSEGESLGAAATFSNGNGGENSGDISGDGENSGGNGDSTGTIVFPDLTFTQSDIGLSYFYRITEIDADQPGYTYDDTVYILQIDVLDKHDGTLRAVRTLTADGAAAETIVFANSYQAIGSTTITAFKTLAGRALAEGQFNFVLQQSGVQIDPVGLHPSSTLRTVHSPSLAFSANAAAIRLPLDSDGIMVQNNADGEVVFPEIAYTEADAGKDFYYTVTEIDDARDGYTYDSREYLVHVFVSDNGDGTLLVEQELLDDGTPLAEGEIPGEEGLDGILFENVYTVADAVLGITAEKRLSGRDLMDGQFEFVLNQVTEAGDFVSEVQRTVNGPDGAVVFDDIVFTQADMGSTFFYQISERDDGLPGYTYDPAVYTIVVDVADAGDGTMRTMYTISSKIGDGQVSGADEIVFSNGYSANGGVLLTATKMLQGLDLAAGVFGFTLTDLDSGSVLQTVQNDADGKILFDEISYSQSQIGTHRYSIQEVIGSDEGFTYDRSVFFLTVEVTDNGDGTLASSVSISRLSDRVESAVEAAEFVNYFELVIDPEIIGTGDNRSAAFYAVIAMISLLLAVAAIWKKVPGTILRNF